MSYKLKEIFMESSVEDPLLRESMLSMLKKGLTTSLKNLVSLATSTPAEQKSAKEAKQAKKVLKFLQKAQAFGVKRISGYDIKKVIAEMEAIINSEKIDRDEDNQLMNLLKGFGKKTQNESKYTLQKIFFEQTNETEDSTVQNQDEKDYNLEKEKPEQNTVLHKAADHAPQLSDEEVLSGLRDDVANYGQYDPALGD